MWRTSCAWLEILTNFYPLRGTFSAARRSHVRPSSTTVFNTILKRFAILSSSSSVPLVRL